MDPKVARSGARQSPPASTGGATGDLVDTWLERRDGGLWVVGACSSCRSRVAVKMTGAGEPATVRCPMGHHLRVGDTRTAREGPGTETEASGPKGDKTTLRGERDETPLPPEPWSPRPAPEGKNPAVGSSQPNGATWPSDRSVISPPEAGQPRAGSKR